MNLLFIAPTDSIHTKRWVEYFAKQQGVQARVVGLSPGGLEIAGATIHDLSADLRGANASNVRLVRAVSRWLAIKKAVARIEKAFVPDVVHVHSFRQTAYTVARLFGVPIVATPWGSDVVNLHRMSLVKRWAARRLVRESRVLTCDAAHMKERLVNLGALPENVTIVYFGTNVGDYNPKNRDDRLPKALFGEEDVNIVISTRALTPLYDVGTFVRTIPLVVGHVERARFVVVGGGEERAMLEDLCRKLGIERYVKFTGRLSDEDLRRYVASADVYVSTALSDGGLAASTAEAMASGVPVVVTDFGDNEEWLDGGKAGIAFPAKDYEALASNIVRLLSEKEVRTEMGRRGRAVIAEKNNYEREMHKMLQIYRKVASAS